MLPYGQTTKYPGSLDKFKEMVAAAVSSTSRICVVVGGKGKGRVSAIREALGEGFFLREIDCQALSEEEVLRSCRVASRQLTSDKRPANLILSADKLSRKPIVTRVPTFILLDQKKDAFAQAQRIAFPNLASVSCSSCFVARSKLVTVQHSMQVWCSGSPRNPRLALDEHKSTFSLAHLVHNFENTSLQAKKTNAALLRKALKMHHSAVKLTGVVNEPGIVRNKPPSLVDQASKVFSLEGCSAERAVRAMMLETELTHFIKPRLRKLNMMAMKDKNLVPVRTDVACIASDLASVVRPQWGCQLQNCKVEH